MHREELARGPRDWNGEKGMSITAQQGPGDVLMAQTTEPHVLQQLQLESPPS